MYSEAGSWLRRRGGVLAYSTGHIGRHRLLLKSGETGATELFSGRHFDGNVIDLDTRLPQTWLFKVDGL